MRNLSIVPNFISFRMPLVPGLPGEILRTSQKDEEYSGKLSTDISQLALHVLGPQKWIKWQPWIEATAAFTYYSLTTLSGLQV